MDASNLLKPAWRTGRWWCIGSTTYKEYRGHLEKDHALARRFQKIDVNEPSVEDAIRILAGLKSVYEEHHQLRFTDDAIRAAVELSARYINDRKLPDKAIDVLDEAGASQKLLPPEKRKPVLGVETIEAIVFKLARVPPKSVGTDDRETLRNLDRDLKTLVFGQDKAIEALVSAIKLARGFARTGKAHRLLFVFGAHGGWQNGSCAANGGELGRRTETFRHVRIYGKHSSRA